MSQNAPMAPFYKLISWLVLVRRGCRSDRISPHNPKVAGSNPAPATIENEGLADARAANPFRLPRLHPGSRSPRNHQKARPRCRRPRALIETTRCHIESRRGGEAVEAGGAEG